MLERYFVKPQTIDEIRNSWIGEAIERYATWLHEQKYSSRVFYRRIPIVKHFGEFTKKNGAKSLDCLPSFIEPFVEYWLNGHGKNCKTSRASKSVENDARNPVQQMLQLVLINFKGRKRNPYAKHPFHGIAPNFFNYLSEERGLRPTTLIHYRFTLNRFENYISKIKLSSLENLSSPIFSAFIAEHRPILSRSSIITLCSTLRTFLRYLHREKLLKKDLSSLIDTPRKYRSSEIPRSISWENIQQMLAAIDRRTKIGKRDFAISLLLITYGLRAHEIENLSLDDIDWKRERLQVPGRKAGHSTAFPLSTIVGEAIIAYLKEARPKTQSRNLFIEVLAPYRPITRMAVSLRISYYLRKAGIPASRPGSHTLRHSCVQRLVDANFPLKTIGDYIGHRSPSSTNVYTKIDIESLREVAMTHGEEVV